MPPRPEDSRVTLLKQQGQLLSKQILEEEDEDDLAARLDTLTAMWKIDNPPRRFDELIDVAAEVFDLALDGDIDHADAGSYGLKFIDAKIHVKELEAIALYGAMKQADLLDEVNSSRVVRVLESLYYAKRMMISMFRAKIAFHTRYELDKDVDERLANYSVRFRWTDTKITGPQRLILYLLDVCQERRYRKFKDSVYRPIIIDGYNTHAFERVSTIEDFVYHESEKESNFEAFLTLTHTKSVGSHVIQQLEKSRDYQLPWLNICRTSFSFNDCVYDAEADAFFGYERGDHVGQDVVTANFFDQGALWLEELGINIPTPNIDHVFMSQGFTGEELGWFYRFAGRMLYDVNTHDGWQVVPFLIGIAGSGKSTVTDKLIGSIYQKTSTGILNNNIEKQFGVSAIADSLVYVGPELKRDFQLDQATFQSMVSGESVVVAEKFKTAFSKTFTAPGWLAGNELPNWTDNSGSIRRRLILFRFATLIREVDHALGARMRAELPAFIVKANRLYRAAAAVHGNRNVWDVLPSSFAEERDRTMAASSLIDSFATSSVFVLNDGGRISRSKFLTLMRSFCDGAGFQYKSYDPGELSAALIKYNVQTVQGTHMEDGRQITCDWFENMYLSEEHAVAAAAVEMVVDDDNSTST